MKRAIDIKVNFAWGHWLNGLIRSVGLATAIGFLSQLKSGVTIHDSLNYFYVAGGAALAQFLTSNRMPDIFPEQPDNLDRVNAALATSPQPKTETKII